MKYVDPTGLYRESDEFRYVRIYNEAKKRGRDAHWRAFEKLHRYYEWEYGNWVRSESRARSLRPRTWRGGKALLLLSSHRKTNSVER